MQDLTPVGLSKDGKRLVLISTAGEEYAVSVDQRLHAALKGDDRLGQLEMKMESVLRPRDIQTRIRAGESPETVAAAAQTSVDAIMGFATPVLAERAHVAQLALQASVRRKSAETSHAARTLGDAARVLLGDLGLYDTDVTWDAWRRDDGRWTLVADYATGGKPRHATFTYDMRGRFVVADDDEARLLTGEAKVVADTETPTGGFRRLAAVVNQDELPLGDDAIELVREKAAVAEPDLLADHADADWMSAREAEIDDAAPAEEALVEEDEPTEEPGADEPVAEESAEDARRAKKKGRASVPSWDEIMFGGGPGE